jgi:CAAX protease family protein
LSLLLLLLVVPANLAVGKPWAAVATGVLAGLVAGGTFLFGAIDLAGAQMLPGTQTGSARLGLDSGVMASGFVAAALTAKPIRERLARILPIDPDNPVHALALVLAVILFGYQVAFLAFTDVLALAQSQPPISVGDLVSQELPFLVVAVAGVGIFIRRNAASVAQRLGFVVPAWWQVALALAAAGVFIGLGQGTEVVSQALTPELAHQLQKTTQHVFGNLDNPIGIAAIAVVPAVCEEALFRGALQPRIGLLATAVLFTVIHTEYGLSLDTLAIFVLAIGLGLIRKYTNTTTSCVTHGSYNLLVGLGIMGSSVTIGLEIFLIGLSAYGIWDSRRRAPIPANPLQAG